MSSPHLPVSTAAFIGYGEAVISLAARSEVADTWTEASACDGMTVGGLTHHLLAQLVLTARLMTSDVPAEAPVIDLFEHYERAPWVEQSRTGTLDSDQNDKDNEAARAGHDAVVGQAREALSALPSLLDDPDRPSRVYVPWQGWALPIHDFLTTRLMEMVVHADDLAASVEVETPKPDEPALLPVLGLLAAVAARRHGPVALVRALSRPQRSTGDISAF